MSSILNYIDGKEQGAINEKTINVFDPSKGSVYTTAPDSDIQDALAAIAAAKRAYPLWSALSIQKRSKYLHKIADEIENQLDTLSQAESLDNGKPLWLAKKVDIPRAAANFRFFAEAITQFATKSHAMTDAINYTLRQPLGVVTCISPWNLPLYLFTWKIAPALAAGNCVIAKPSEVTPMTAYLLAKICDKVGLPPGVLNILHGRGEQIGESITTHHDIKAISFTGSTRVGQLIAKAAIPSFKKVSLEMGGKNPNIIFDDCDFEKMMSTTMRSSFANQGQICLCGSRILIQSSIYDRFKTEFIKRTKALVVAPPTAEKVNLGAIVSAEHYKKILSCLALAKKEGAKILAGGEAITLPSPHDQGWYIAPTILEGLGPNCRTNQEEIFGPVVTLQSFDTEEEALQLANASDYGLSATLWTQDISKAHRMASQIQAGIVWINTWLLRDLRTPFGGVKSSGVGREGGEEALRFFTEAKNVCIQW